MQAAREYIEAQYGEEYVSATGEDCQEERQKIQDAHEAIRPTDITRLPAMIKESLVQRSVPSVSADLETFYCQPHVSSKI